MKIKSSPSVNTETVEMSFMMLAVITWAAALIASSAS